MEECSFHLKGWKQMTIALLSMRISCAANFAYYLDNYYHVLLLSMLILHLQIPFHFFITIIIPHLLHSH